MSILILGPLPRRMKWSVLLTLCSILGTCYGGPAVGGQHAETIDLRAYQWSHRVLIIGSPSTDHSLYRSLVQALERQAQSLHDRDMLVFHLVESGGSRAGERPLSPHAAAALREQLRLVSGQLMMVLIGKDGGEKLRRTNRVDLTEMLALIDTMPMRQHERRERGR